MENQFIKDIICALSVWEKGEVRAPHKPLLTLLILGHYQNGHSRLVKYMDIEKKLNALLKEFGPYRKSYHPEYPFWYLKNDQFWELDNVEGFRLKKGKNQPLVSEFKKHNPNGGFTKEIYDGICTAPSLIVEIAENLLDSHFPESTHEDICSAVGLDLSRFTITRKKRNPEFRDKVLRAYEYKCAICDYNIRIGDSPVGLEAAHIKWHQAGGPCAETNALALCSLHHKLFDRGAFTINREFQLIISEWAHGTNGFNELLHNFSNRKISSPRKIEYQPSIEYLDWHFSEVFRQ
ncbi:MULTISPECIES: phosphorothioated DNA-binding restriction endonuclease [unclassified Oleiphilus]|uniref:phosphorothioated DNA-binding restriction endonuclease n=1 Tax=unclassified Oleiphilus TaxID=2631174 RepID=UPI0007C31F2C|nr:MULTISPECIES: HNH endonuclease [unclassified Oleiphilus]KZZ35387.1 hypothetical protein A3757_15805 [Oleiphilus sp. HI0117]KZZ53365.1 hypothetical protein A3761_17220 [Oleiphilus sp. HI0123]